jgi:hypothetical protein
LGAADMVNCRKKQTNKINWGSKKSRELGIPQQGCANPETGQQIAVENGRFEYNMIHFPLHSETQTIKEGVQPTSTYKSQESK